MRIRHGVTVVCVAAAMLVACGDDDGSDSMNGDPNATSSGEPNNASGGVAKWGMELSGDGLMASAEGNNTSCCLAGLFQGGDDASNAVWTVAGAPSTPEEIEATTYAPAAGSSFVFPGVARCVQSVGQMVELTVTDVGPPVMAEFTATVRCTDEEDANVVLSQEGAITGWFQLD